MLHHFNWLNFIWTLDFYRYSKILTLDWPKLSDNPFIHFMCRLPTSIYKHTCMCAIKKLHKYFDTSEQLWQEMHVTTAALLLTAWSFVRSLPSCLGEWGGHGLWLESFVQWGVTETRGSGQNIDRYVINVSEPHIRTNM